MFARKYRLSEEERKALVNLRARYVYAIEARSCKPDDFDAVIEQLKRLAAATHAFVELQRPYLQKGLDVMRSNSFSCFSFLPSFNFPNWGGEALSPALQFLQEAHKILHPKSLVEFYEQEFKKEPRITGVSYNFKHDREKITTNGHAVVTESLLVTCTVTFMDETKLTFHTLDEEKQLAEARKMFEAKMQELSPKRRLTCR